MEIVIVVGIAILIAVLIYMLFFSDKENVEYKEVYEKKNQSQILNNRKKEREAIINNLIQNLNSDDTLNEEEVSKIIDKISSTVKESEDI